MTKIDSITYGHMENTMIHMDNGASLPEQAIAHLADTRLAHEETYDATMFIEAAWNAAYPVPDGATIPVNTGYMYRSTQGTISACKTYETPLRPEPRSQIYEYRTITPLPEPEPWETARYCYADGLFHERREDEHGTFWLTVEDNPGTYDRAELAKHNPRPVTIEGHDE